MVACTKCGTDAEESDAVCSICGGFLAGKARPGLGSDSSGAPVELFSVNVDSRNVRVVEPDQEPVLAQASVWPVMRQTLTLVFYAVFVICVAVVVNWMLRRL